MASSQSSKCRHCKQAIERTIYVRNGKPTPSTVHWSHKSNNSRFCDPIDYGSELRAEP